VRESQARSQVVVASPCRGRWELLPLPPTGRAVTWTEMHICRMADGQLVEHWPVIDQLALLQQLGALPEGDLAHVS